MGDRKWEDLPIDCLADIFARVGVVSLVYEVPYVCKSWHKATLSPLCWKSLTFPKDLPDLTTLDSLSDDGLDIYDELTDGCRDRFDELSEQYCNSMNTFAKFVIRRSCGSANLVAFPPNFVLSHEVFNSIGEGCPNLKRLVLPSVIQLNDMSLLSSVICKWKNLEALVITGSFLLQLLFFPGKAESGCKKLDKFIPQISVHCKKLVSLGAIGVGFGKNEASAIANLLPNIEFLTFSMMLIDWNALLVILKGCKKLVHLDVHNCLTFEVDDEILKLAAHITTFKYGISEYYVRKWDYCVTSD